MALNEVGFTVRGLPVAQGTARAFVAGGKARIATDSNRPNSPIGAWRTAIASQARDAMGARQRLQGPVRVDATFVFPRPKGHFLPANARRSEPELRLDAPGYVTAKPDVDKLARALLDAITQVVIGDDAEVATLWARKLYADEFEPGVMVHVGELRRTR